MGSTPNKAAIGTAQSATLTTAYGDGATGWSSDVMGVGGYDHVTVLATITWNSETQVDFSFAVGAETGDLFPMLKRDPSDGQAAIEEVKVQKSAVADGTRFAFRLDVRAASSLQVNAKGNVGGGILGIEVVGEPSVSLTRNLEV